MSLSRKLPWIVAGLSLVFASVVLAYATFQLTIRNRERQANNTPQQPTVSRVLEPSPAPQEPGKPTQILATGGQILSGTVLTQDNKPVLAAEVVLVYIENDAAQVAKTVSGADGRFEFRGIPGDVAVSLSVKATGYQESKVKQVPLPATDVFLFVESGSSVLLKLQWQETAQAAPESYDGMAKVMLAKRAATLAEGERSGTPFDASAAPGQFLPNITKEVQVQAGRATLSGLAPGVYKVEVQIGTRRGESAPFSLTASSNVEVAVNVGARFRVSGLVRQRHTGSPLQGLTVTAQRSGDTAEVSGPAVSDVAGRFQTEDLDPGTYTFTVTQKDRPTFAFDNIYVGPGGFGERELALDIPGDSAGLTLRVVDQDQRPVAKAPITIINTSQPSAPPIFMTTSGSGVATIPGLTANRYQVSVSLPQQSERQKVTEIDVVEGKETRLVFFFPQRVRVHGRANAGSRAFSGLLNFTQRGEVRTAEVAKTQPDGTFTAELEPGTYVVTGSGQKQSAQVTVLPDINATLDVQFGQ